MSVSCSLRSHPLHVVTTNIGTLYPFYYIDAGIQPYLKIQNLTGTTEVGIDIAHFRVSWNM